MLSRAANNLPPLWFSIRGSSMLNERAVESLLPIVYIHTLTYIQYIRTIQYNM